MAGDYWDDSYSRRLKGLVDKNQFEADTRWRTVQKIHSFVFENVDYELTGNDIWRPDYVLEHKQIGDCQDISVLIATLLDICGIPFRIIDVGNRDEDGTGHAIAQALLLEKPDTVYDLHFDSCDEGYWVSVDPAYHEEPGKVRKYVGKYVKPFVYEYYNFRKTEIEKGV